jgi:hypothetical protein
MTQETINKMLINAHDDSAAKDFEFVRANLYNLIENQKSAVDRLTDLADRSQSARVYEVLAKFIDSFVTSNKELLEFQSKIRGLKDLTAAVNSPPRTINQTAIFVGTTSDLQRQIKTMIKNDKDVTKTSD